MKKIGVLFIGILFLCLLTSVSAETNVYEFYQEGCPHCANVKASGILEKVDALEDVNVYSLDTSVNYTLYSCFKKQLNIQDAVPLAVIQQGNKASYLLGDKPIIANLENAVLNFSGIKVEICDTSIKPTIGMWGLIMAALGDSFNPCAFGVLLFLMVSLINMGSAKRALKAGIFYSFVVFVVYFLAGFGIFKIIQQFTSIRSYIYLAVGLFVLVLSLIEFRDYIFATQGKESILRISPRVKPFIEKYSKKGTIYAIMVLGVAVALFELPCTGGIYVGIIPLIPSIIYLLIYNLIFILPLIILTILIYYGTSAQKLQHWTSKNRTWMKLASAIVMLAIAGFLLWDWILKIIG